VVLFDKTESYEKELILNIVEKLNDEKEKLPEGTRVSFLPSIKKLATTHLYLLTLFALLEIYRSYCLISAT